MKQKHLIVLLEDDTFFQIIIEKMLEGTEFEIVKVFSETAGIKQFLEQYPDAILLSDLYLQGKPKGIELIEKLNIPDISIICMTTSGDRENYERLQPYVKQYIVKPFHRLTLLSSLQKITDLKKETKLAEIQEKSYLFLKSSGNKKERVFYNDIIYLEVEGNYTTIYTKGRKYVEKVSLTKFLEKLPPSTFLRIHHRYAVHKLYVQNLLNEFIILPNNVRLPLSDTYRPNILSYVQKLDT